MNAKIILSFITVLAVLMTGAVSATELAVSGASGITTTFNDVELKPTITAIAGTTDETVPIRVSFTALSNAEDVRVKIWMDGFRDDVEAETSRFTIIQGSTYSKLLSLRLPSDMEDLSKVYKLRVSIVNADARTETEYSVNLQREDYSNEVLSVDYDSKVSAGDNVPVTIVIKNIGMQDIEDGYVIVAIPSLGIASRAYLGDIVAIENCSSDCDEQDAVQKTVYLKVPETAQAGLYELVVKAYSRDSIETVTKTISIEDSVSTLLVAPVKNQDIKVSETKKYDLILVNSGNGIKVYNIKAVSGEGISVSVPSVVTVGADSSLTLQVMVTALSSAVYGQHTFSVDVNGQNVALTANVIAGTPESTGKISTSVLALTVILVIIFVVLLIVLIVLITRKDKQPEQVETSYY